MTNEEYNFYKLLLDALALLLSVGAGVYIENKWNIVQKIRIKFVRKSRTQQSTQTDRSPGSNTSLIGGDNYGSVNQTTTIVQPIPSTVSLSPHQNHIVGKVNAILQARGQSGSFESLYSNAARFINERQAQLAASEYYAACVQIQGIFLERSTYREGVNQDSRKDLEKALGDLKGFVDQHLNDMNQLNPIIEKTENALLTLFPHVL